MSTGTIPSSGLMFDRVHKMPSSLRQTSSEYLPLSSAIHPLSAIINGFVMDDQTILYEIWAKYISSTIVQYTQNDCVDF